MLTGASAELVCTPGHSTPMLKVIVPRFDEEQNLPLSYERVCRVLDAQVFDWELVAIDDQPWDRTFESATRLACPGRSPATLAHTSLSCAALIMRLVLPR
jgi:hypothetical protein